MTNCPYCGSAIEWKNGLPCRAETAAKRLGIGRRQFYREAKKYDVHPTLAHVSGHRIAMWTNAQIEKLMQLRMA